MPNLKNKDFELIINKTIDVTNSFTEFKNETDILKQKIIELEKQLYKNEKLRRRQQWTRRGM